MPPPKDEDHAAAHLREIFGGSEIVSQVARSEGLLCQQSIDLRRHWNILWDDHLHCCLDRMKAKPALITLITPPGAATASGNEADRKLCKHVLRIVNQQLNIGGHVILDCTKDSHWWKLADAQLIVEDHRLQNFIYSWCGAGTVDQTSGRK